MSKWQLIKTAPRDGFFLVYENGAMRTMQRDNGVWSPPGYAYSHDQYGDKIVGTKWKVGDVIREPTHWMPLPEPPTETRP